MRSKWNFSLSPARQARTAGFEVQGLGGLRERRSPWLPLLAGVRQRGLGTRQGTLPPLPAPASRTQLTPRMLWDGWLRPPQGNQDFGLSFSYVPYLPREVTHHWGQCDRRKEVSHQRSSRPQTPPQALSSRWDRCLRSRW